MPLDLKQSVIVPVNTLRKRLLDMITPATMKDVLPSELLLLEADGVGHTAAGLALYSDLLRLIIDAGYGTSLLGEGETSFVEPLVAGIVKQLARQRSNYGLIEYQQDEDVFGYACDSPKWAGVAVCVRAATSINDPQLIQAYGDILLTLNTALTNKADASLRECRSLLTSALKPPPRTLDAFPAASQPHSFLNSIGMKLILIPPGEFQMGMSVLDDMADPVEERPRLVRIPAPFLMGAYLVTQQQYEAVVGSNPSRFRGRLLPVERLSWRDAEEFCRRLSDLPEEVNAGRVYRLPSEAEWEYACRAGTITRFSTGHDLDDSQARFASSPNGITQPTTRVGSYSPNPWGLYDMHGNVWEWTNDWFSKIYDYVESPAENPCGPVSGTYHTLRGGSASESVNFCRSSSRGEAYLDAPSFDLKNLIGWYGDFGVRVACSLPPATNS